jgi:MFS superfamily sulfate permease-like transporter
MYPNAVEVPGLVIYRFGGPLIFANAGTFRDEIRAIARREPTPRWILVASEAIVDVDVTAADMLEELDGELEAANIELVFAELKDAVRGEIKGYGLDWLADRDTFYPTISAAVKAYRAAFGVPKPSAHHAEVEAKTDAEPAAKG